VTQEQYVQFFKDKAVTLMGLGLLGRGVGDAAFLAQHCKKVFVTDTKSADELRVSVDALKAYKNIEFVLAGHDTKIFENVDFIVKGAGVRSDNPFLAHAEKHGIPIYMSTALFAYLSPLKTIGVTGTRGKTTTTCMIAEILKQAGKNVLLGGNIRGVSTLALLDSAEPFDVAVLELDSWQMQGFDTLGISPNISVFTNLYPDHMNYYDGDMARYLHDKSAIFRHQKPGDTLVTTAEMTKVTAQERASGNNQSNWTIAPPLPEAFDLKIPGAHNLANAALAKAVGIVCGLGDKTIDAALHHFDGIDGRLKLVGQAQGRTFYNDSNATTQEATLAALTSFPSQSVVLIFGGADKGLPIDHMMAYIAQNDVRCVLIKGTGSDRVLKMQPTMPVVDSMPDAVQTAFNLSKSGDNIILSPAFASFGVFQNEYDRSDQFLSEVKKRMSGDTQKQGCACPH
jgi:UDP-N-acetylmuramoylalanine--D-glutamate ligase